LSVPTVSWPPLTSDSESFVQEAAAVVAVAAAEVDDVAVDEESSEPQAASRRVAATAGRARAQMRRARGFSAQAA
jgi:hypothetical protein